MSSIEIREARDKDLPAILETLRAALGESPILRRTPDLWHWKHVSNPFGESIVLVAASGDDTIAGIRAFMRWELETGGGVLRCVRPVDTATHPDFTRRGIFRTLTMSAIELARDDGVDLIFNTPNASSAPGYLKMGWSHAGWIGAQLRVRPGRAIIPDATTRPTVDLWAPKALAASHIPMVETPSHDSALLRTPRRASYLDWRFRQHPYASYGWIAGSAGNGLVVRASQRRGRSELVAADILGEPDRSPFAHAARQSRARYLAGWFSPGTPKRRAAVRGGLLPIPGLRTLRLVALQLTDFPVNPFDLGSWDLSTSDLELL